MFALPRQDIAGVLGAPRFENEVAMRTSVPGVSTGLAWTPVGGDILFIEATRVAGSGRLILTGDHGPVYSQSYYMLTIAGLISDGRNLPRSNYAPRTLGSSASRLLPQVANTNRSVIATPLQIKMVRLWIDSGAAYPGTYAALGCGMIGHPGRARQHGVRPATPCQRRDESS